jgi:hypothetical protein
VVKSKTPVDVVLNIINVADTPPVAKIDGSTTPSVRTVQAGQPVSFTLTGTDADGGASVTLYSAGLPAGATMTPALPFTDTTSPATSVFNWAPTTVQAGTYVLTFFALDNLGLQAQVSITLIVNRPPVANCKPATIIADANCDAVVTPALINNVSSDPDGNPITLAVSDALNLTPAATLMLSGAGDH